MKKVMSTDSQKKYTPRTGKYSLIVRRSASSGLGLFTKDRIKRGEFIIEYYGPILSKKEADEKAGKYLFEINSKKTIDGSPRYNTARYINHSCKPNCKTRVVKGKIYIYAKHNIKENEELSYDYGKEYMNGFIKANGCRCQKCREKNE